MRHFKLYKELTLGQKIMALVLILNLSVTINFTPKVWAQETPADAADQKGDEANAAAEPSTEEAAGSTTNGGIKITRPDGTTVEIESAITSSEDSEASITQECEKIEDDLNKRLKDMASACAVTNLGRSCLSGLFLCDEASSSEECEGIKELNSASATEIEKQRLEDERDELEALKEEKKEILEKQETAQEAVNDYIKEFEDKKDELTAADEELKFELKNIKGETAAKLATTQAGIQEAEERHNALSLNIAEQQKQMIQFMTAEKLKCNAKSKDEAQKFYTQVRSCTTGRGNCTLSLNTLIRNGRRSLAEMAQAYGIIKRRQCLRTDGQDDFAVQYRAMNALMKNQNDQIAAQRASLVRQREILVGQLRVAEAEGQIANSEASLKQAQKTAALSAELGRIEAQRKAKAALALQLQNDAKVLQTKIEAQTEKVANIRRDIATSLSSGSLNKFREAQLLASGLLNEAEDAQSNSCECSGAIQNISELSGSDFCTPRPSRQSNEAEATEEDVDLIDAALE